MRQIETDEFRTPQRAGKAEQEERAVAETGEIRAAGCDQPLDVLGSERRRSPRWLAMGACDATQGLADRRMSNLLSRCTGMCVVSVG